MYGTFGTGAPVFYDHANAYTSFRNPSTQHATDTGLSRFFQRYLLQRAISQFKWRMPGKWAENYFLYCVYCWGFISVIDSKKFGVIPQGCSLEGYGVMYQPTNVVISNPLLGATIHPRINRDCALIRLQPDYGGIYDLVTTYADLMAMTLQTAGTNIEASKLAYLFFAANKSGAETFKSMWDSIASGEPAVVVDKQLLDEQGKPKWLPFTNSLSSNYIAGDLLNDLREWERRFDTEIGIPHTNTDKKERLVSGEVNANAVESFSRVEMWLETLQKDCAKASSMFGIDLYPEWRINPREMMQAQTQSIGGSKNV